MPEYSEVLATLYTIERWFQHVQQDTPLWLKAIWADATEKERAVFRHSDPTGRPAQGLVYKLDHTSTVRRGSSGNQKAVWPYLLDEKPSQQTRGKKKIEDSEIPMESLDGLRLQGVSRTPRTIILDFGPMVLQV